MSGSLYAGVDRRGHSIDDDDAVAAYARSPRTAAEEAAQFLPGSRFLNTTEFKRVYLGDGERATEGTMLLSPSAFSSGPQRSRSRQPGAAPTVTVTGLLHAGRVPRRPPSSSSSSGLPKSRRGRALHKVYGPAVSANPTSFSCPPGNVDRAPQETRTAARMLLDPSTGQTQAAAGHAGGAVDPSSHVSLSQQLRHKVRAARRSPSAHVAGPPLSSRGDRTEDAWLSLVRELGETKEQVRVLQQQLRHAQVLVRTLHGVASDDTEDSDEDGDDGQPTAESAVEAEQSSTANVNNAGTPSLPEKGEKKALAAEMRPKEYWQRRSYFLEKQHEELVAEVERLRRDARGSKVRALVKELEVVRGQLKRYRRREEVSPNAAAGTSHVRDEMSDDNARTLAKSGGAAAASDDVDVGNDKEGTNVVSGPPVVKRWASSPAVATTAATDELFLRQKDELIRDLRDRLRLLTQQYQKADAQVIASARQLEDLTHRYSAVQAEWKALQRLPQELARVQQQLNTAEARLLDSDREVEAFHQLFDTLESPATLRAIIDERDHLVELLRQTQQQQAALRDEMKASQQQALRAVEAKHRTQREEEQAMARDREAQLEQVVRKLRKDVETLRQQMAAQQEAYEAQLAEAADAREADLTERLLDSVAHGNEESAGGRVQNTNNASTELHAASQRSEPYLRSSPQSTTLSSRPPSRDGPRNMDAAVASSTSSSELLQTAPTPPQESMDALVQDGDTTLVASPTHATPAPHTQDTQHASAGNMASTPHAAHDETASSLTSTTDSASSVDDDDDDTVTESDEEVEAAVQPPAQRAPPASSALPLPPPPEAAATVKVHQELISDEDVSEDATEDVTSPTGSDSDDVAQESDTDDEEEEFNHTVEKMEHVSSDSSDSESTTPVRVPGELRIGFGFHKPHDSATQPPAPAGGAAAAAAPATTTAATSESPSESRRRHLFDFPSPPIKIVHPVSILINRGSVDGLNFTRHLRPVVHSPGTSPQQTATATSDPTPSQQTGTTSGTDEESSTTYSHTASSSSSPSSSSSSSPSRSASAPSAPAPPQEASPPPHVTATDNVTEEASQPSPPTNVTETKQEEDEKEKGEIHNESKLDEVPASPIVEVVGEREENGKEETVVAPVAAPSDEAVPTPPSLQSALVPATADVAAPLSLHATVHTPTHTAVPALHVSAVNTPAAALNNSKSGSGAPIPSPPAITPLVASNLYPPRTSSNHLLPTLNLEDNFTDGAAAAAGPQRGGASPQLLHSDHNSSFDITHQFSGNASFDFVGPLAERHRMEDMQNNIVLSLHTSPATLPSNAAAGGGGGTPFPSTAPAPAAPNRTFGAAGLRKTPSPPLLPEARQQSGAVFPSAHNSPKKSSVAGSDSRDNSASFAEPEKSAPAAPVLVAADSNVLDNAQTSSSGGSPLVAVDGPAQAEDADAAASTEADAAPFMKAASLHSSHNSDDASPSPIVKGTPQEATLFSFAMEEQKEGEGAATNENSQVSGTASAAVASPPSQQEKSASSDLPSSVHVPDALSTPKAMTVADEDKKEQAAPSLTAGGSSSSSSAGAVSAAAPSLPPLPPMVKVPSPPSPAGAIPLPPRVAVPLPPSAPMPPAPPSPQPPSASSTVDTRKEEEGEETALMSASAAQGMENVLSVSSSSDEAHTLSGADMEEEEEEEEGSSTPSAPPMVAGGTVEKTRSPPDVRPLDEWSLRGTPYAPPPLPHPPQSEVAAPRYGASAAASMLGEADEEEEP